MIKIKDFYLNNFDVLRLLAAFMVLFSHCFELAGRLNAEPLYLLSGGQLRFSTIGLYIFFFISGYLVTESFFRSRSVINFLWKRFLRIYPALIFVVLITVFVIGPLFTLLPISIYFKNGITYNYLLTATGFFTRFSLPGVFESQQYFDHGVNGSLWSISLELKLYLSLIVFATITKFNKIAGILIPLITAYIAAYFTQAHLFHFNEAFDLLHVKLLCIFFTGYAFRFYYEKLDLEWYVLTTLLMLYILGLTFYPTIRCIAEPLFFAYFTFIMAYKVRFKVLKMDISYGVYIFAFPLTQILITLTNIKESIQLIILVSICVIPLSILSWLFIEKKALSFKQKIK